MLVKQRVFNLMTAAGIGGPYWLSKSPFLQEHGWLRSFKLGRSVDGYGAPVPWWPYAFTRMLAPRLTPTMRVFEYGSGASTLWLAQRVATVTSVEHSTEWVKHVRKSCPGNARIILATTKEDYVNAAPRAGQFDLVVVDGEWRFDSVVAATDSLHATGVIVLDDTQRPQLRAAADYLARAGFRALSIGGLGALCNEVKETTVFYRQGNCLNI